jgi:hypothetical protein
MWRLVREGIRFYRNVLLISWGAGAGIYLLVLTIVAVVGSVKDLHELVKGGVQLPLAILIASMVAGLIVFGTERSESRVRMHMMLPLPIGQVAVARVLLPAALVFLGWAVSHVIFAVMLALEGSPVLSPRHANVDFIAVQLLFWIQMALAIREILELRQRARWSGALGAKALLATIVAVMIVVQLMPIGGAALRVALIVPLVVAVMAQTVVLFERRAAFTK